jgi:hypothetical protein
MTTEEQKEQDAIVNSNIPNEMAEGIKFIAERTVSVRTYNLMPEAIYSALQAMKEDPNISIQRAFEIGCEEWDV